MLSMLRLDYIIFGGLGVFLLLSILTSDFQDPTFFNQLYPSLGVKNWTGLIGALIALVILAFVIYYIDKYIPSLELTKDYLSLLYLASGILISSLIITWVSTYFATQRFLNLQTNELYY